MHTHFLPWRQLCRSLSLSPLPSLFPWVGFEAAFLTFLRLAGRRERTPTFFPSFLPPFCHISFLICLRIFPPSPASPTTRGCSVNETPVSQERDLHSPLPFFFLLQLILCGVQKPLSPHTRQEPFIMAGKSLKAALPPMLSKPPFEKGERKGACCSLVLRVRFLTGFESGELFIETQ